MKVDELVDPKKDCLLHHFLYGWVAWREQGPGSGRRLVWARGAEQGKPLLADAIVLFGKGWRIGTQEEMEFDR